MDEIGSLFKATRESSGISIGEVSTDLNIKDVVIENIEDGKIGSFKDIYELKNYVESYAKYLGLDEDKIVDKFNEYLFEYTSKIPVKEIEEAVLEQTREMKVDNQISSPYTKQNNKPKKGLYILIYVLIIILVILVIFWSVKQITVGGKTATIISYGK